MLTTVVLECSEELSKREVQVVVGEAVDDIVWIVKSVLFLYVRGGVCCGIVL